MKVLRRGYLYWAHLDKRRPVVVISTDVRNERAVDVVVLSCSMRQPAGSWHVSLKKGEGGLPAPTVVKCESPYTVTGDLVEPRPLGQRLPESRMRQIEGALLLALGISRSP